MSPITIYTPEKRTKIGTYSSEFIYSLVGANSGGTFNSSNLLNNFNSQWSPLHSGGSWSVVDNPFSFSGLFINQSLSSKHSKFITEGIDWPRNLDITTFIRLTSVDDYVNLFTCVQDASNFYRISIRRLASHITLYIYKTIDGTEEFLDSHTSPLTWNAENTFRVNILLSPTHISTFIGATDSNFNAHKMTVSDSSLEKGSFGIGSEYTSFSFKGPYIRTSSLNSDGLIFRLPYNNTVADNEGWYVQFNDNNAVPFELMSPTGFYWNRYSVDDFTHITKLAHESIPTSKLVFRNQSLRNYTVYNRVFQFSSGSNAFIFDFLNIDNYSYIYHSDVALNLYRVSEGVESLILSIGASYGTSYSEFTDWQYVITDNLLEINRNGELVYGAKPPTWRKSLGWKILGGRIGLISNGLGTAWDEFEVHEYGDQLLLDLKFDNTHDYDGTELSTYASVYPVVENRSVVGTALFLNNTNIETNLLYSNKNIQTVKNKRIKVDLYYVGSEIGLYLNWDELPYVGFTISSNSEIFIFQSDGEFAVKDLIHFTSNTGSYLNAWTTLEVEVLNTYIKFYVNDILVYGILPSSLISVGNFGIYSIEHTPDNTGIKNLEVFDIGREIIDSGQITDINEAIKTKGAVALRRDKTIISNAAIKSKQEKLLTSLGLIKTLFQNEIDSEGRIKVTWITATPDIFDPEPSVWDLFEVRDDIITQGATKLSYEEIINSTGQIRSSIDFELDSTGNIKVPFQKTIDTHGSVSIFSTNFISNTVENRGDWTNDSSQTFYSILNDPSVSYYKYKVTTDSNDSSFDQENWNGSNVTVNIGPSNQIWYFIAYAYDASDTLIGKDIFWLNYDTVSPIVEGAHILESPIYELQDINVIVNQVSDTSSVLIYEIFKNGLLYKTHETTGSVLSVLFTDNDFTTGDQLDVVVTASDEAGNTSSSSAGYNYGGDENGNGPNEYIVLQRYYYNIFIWQGTFTEEDLNAKYCPNLNLELQKTFDCPIYESGMMFLPNTHKDCPYCHYPMTLGTFTPEKKVFETNFPRNTPISQDEVDQLPILKIGLNYEFKDQPKSWLYNLNYRETPYKQDIINLGSFSTLTTDKTIHFEIQISKASNFLNENIIYSIDSFDENSDFEYFSNSTNGWMVISSNGLKNLTSATLRFKLPMKLELDKTFYYRWRIIEYKDGSRNYKEWLPIPSGISSFQIQKFSTPTEVWDGGYREHLLKDNFGFNGFYNEEDILNSHHRGSASVTEYDNVCRLVGEVPDFEVMLAIPSTEQVIDNDLQNCIMKIKVRSNSQVSLYPVILLEEQVEVIITDHEFIIVPDETWQVFEIDFSQLSSWSTLENKTSFGFVSNLSEFASTTYIDVDFIALLKKNPSYIKRYFYPHVISNTMRCMFEQKSEGVNIYNTSGFCLKGHTSGITWKGEWSILSSYKFEDGVIYNGFQYASLKDVPSGIDPTNEEYWELLGDDISMEGDGLYEGGSIAENPLTTGFCRNTVCPDYTPLPEINEYIEINYDAYTLESVGATENFNPNDASGLLFCPNVRIQNNGFPECRNNFYKTPIPASRKICTRNEGIRINNTSFGYVCNKFSEDAKLMEYDTGGANADTSEGITKIPATREYNPDSWDSTIWDYREYFYEKVQPNHFYWNYSDDITLCDGFLRDENGNITSEVCGYPLVGFSEFQQCNDCGTPLVPLNMINTNLQLLKCSNNNKTIKMIPECSKGMDHIPFSREIISCPESGDILIGFLPTPLLSITTPARQLVLENDQLELVADGLPKTWAYRGWDLLLNQPYSGPIGGVSGPFVHGDRWQGVSNIKWLKATENEIIDWQTEIQINSNLVNRMSKEILDIDVYKDLHIKEQWKRNVSGGDHKSLYRRPGTYVEYYDFKFDTGEIYFSNGSLENDVLKIQNIADETSLVRTRDVVNPQFRSDEFFGLQTKFNLNTVGAIPTMTTILEVGLSSLVSELVSFDSNEVSLTGKDDTKQFVLFQKRITSGNNFIDVYACTEDSNNYNQVQSLFSINVNTLPDNTEVTVDIKYFSSILNFHVSAGGQSASHSWSIGPSTVQVAEKYAIYYKLTSNNIAIEIDNIRFYQPQAQKSGYLGSNEEYIKKEILLSKPGLSTIDEMDQFRVNSNNTGYHTADIYTETYFKIEFDPKPTFDSNRGYPMRSIIGKGYTCLNKNLASDVSAPDGFSGASFCEKYKFVWSEEDAKSMGYKCPSCKYKLFLHRLDSTLLSLTTTDKDNKTPSLLPKIIYQLLNEELPGLSSKDFVNENLSIQNKFFESSSSNPKILPNNWTEKKMARLVNGTTSSMGTRLDNWFDTIDFTNWTTVNPNYQSNMVDFADSDLIVFEQNTVKQSIYTDRQLIKDGNFVEQKIKTEYGTAPYGYTDPVLGYNSGYKIHRYNAWSAFYSIALSQTIDLNNFTTNQKREIFGDLRISAYFPSAGFHWSASESAALLNSVISNNIRNASRKVASLQFELRDINNDVLGVYHIILIDSLYDYYDHREFPYEYPNLPWVYFKRSKLNDEKDKWNFYDFDIYEMISVALNSLAGNKTWNDIDKVEIRLCTSILRNQQEQWYYDTYPISDVYNYNYNPSLAPNFAVTIWGHCYQGHKLLLKDGDNTKLKYPPTYWDGNYYYRIVPYSFKLNPQWLEWYTSKAKGWGTHYNSERWLMEDLVHLGGVPPNKWIYRENESLINGKFNYSFQWNTIYHGEDHIIVPKGLE